MSKTNHIFIPGKISYLLDIQAGSSAKGNTTSYVIKNQSVIPFLCTTNTPNASHTVIDNDFSIIYKILPSGAHLLDKYSVIYIGPGAIFSVDDLLKEMEICGISEDRVKIHPSCSILQVYDSDYEKGLVGIDLESHFDIKFEGTMKTGTTASGSGAARARKILRRPSCLYAKDIKELEKMICHNMTEEIIDRLNNGQSGFHDLCQGFQLSLSHPKMFPYTTSRNVTVSAGLDDMMLPPSVVGNVILNMRTFPIRIHSKKYISKAESIDYIKKDENGMILIPEKYQDKKLYDIINDENKGAFISSIGGVHLTWDEKESGEIPFEEMESYSGPGYDDQIELDWEFVTEQSNSETPLFECTTLTKLPRRVFTFSRKNLEEAIVYNKTNHKTFISITFANYIDADMVDQNEFISKKFHTWMTENIIEIINKFADVEIFSVSTGKQTDSTILL